MAEIFGWVIGKKVTSPAEEPEKQLASFVPPTNEDGLVTVASGGGFQYIDLDGIVKNDSELITRYRTMAQHPSLNVAITSIVNEAIVNEPEQETVSIELKRLKSIPDATKRKIETEFANILALYNFEENAYNMFKRWYVDGRIYYHAMVDPKNIAAGIQEFRYIDPRKIRKIKEVKVKPRAQGTVAGEEIIPNSEFYIFNENGFGRDNASTMQTPGQRSTEQYLKISKDSIIHVTSGEMDVQEKTVISYLHKAIRPLNMLTMLEDAVVIYRLSRAPERRVFYVDVSGLPKAKAEQHMSALMTNMKNKVVYDSETGSVRDTRKFSTMMEDIWLPRRGEKGTQVDTLPGGENLGKIEDVEYFQKRMYQALEIPTSRLNAEDVYTLGRATEISREEIAFEKFVTRLRTRFSLVLLNALRLQLILKNIIKPEDWDEIKNKIALVYAKDNLFAELKDNEVQQGRLNLLMEWTPYVGRYISNTSIRSQVLKQTEEEIKAEDKLIESEKSMQQYIEPLEGDDGGMGGGFGDQQQGGQPNQQM